MKWGKLLMLCIGLIVVIYWISIPSYNSYKQKAKAQEVAHQAPVPISPEPLPPDFSKRSAGETVMNLVRQQANVYEEGDHLVIEFREYLYLYDINKRLAYVRRVADADAVISGKARLIYYYNPGGKLLAKADPWRGVRLVEEMK
jgi:hypothetical protein